MLSLPLSPTPGLLFHIFSSSLFFSSPAFLSSHHHPVLLVSSLLSFLLDSSPLLYSPLLPSPLISSPFLSSLVSSLYLSSFISSPLSPFPLSSALAGSSPSFVLCGWMNVTGLHTKQAGSLALGRAQRLNRITHIQSLCHSNAPAPRGPMIDTPRRQRA